MKSEKGQALVEMALVLPILLMLVFGIMDFGRIFHAYLTIDHAGREGARAASVGGDDAHIRAVIEDTASGLNDSSLNIAISPEGDRDSGSEVRIILDYDIDFLTPVVGSLASPFNLSDTTVMRVE
ncbi:hypothetical protein GCM10010954_23520 [Halobacillus andaensis]|uniref:TadE-like domain-containing protein n=1 Tax=Halobacillus andaensis TaxID=1176239 RepID=A0A917B4X6_HALAA|nr:TadE family protein [Halobacillus andaensis]MBP2006057.1 Flp pilus assembly protein TadG [Halobacillus andaensis]GGF23937.1 hypothetical protein GCM10010954_23520 [Halobacillus andaensis]